MNKQDIITLLKIKSLLNHLDYIIKDDHKILVENYHKLCRKYCNWGKK